MLNPGTLGSGILVYLLLLAGGCKSQPQATLTPKLPRLIGPASMSGQTVTHKDLNFELQFPEAWQLKSIEEAEHSRWMSKTLYVDKARTRQVEADLKASRLICSADLIAPDDKCTASISISCTWTGREITSESYLREVIAFMENGPTKPEFGSIDSNQKLGSLKAARVDFAQKFGSVKVKSRLYTAIFGYHAFSVSFGYRGEDDLEALEQLRNSIVLNPN